MTVPVLTAVTGESWEATLVSGLERDTTAVTVVRRCVDLPDLLAAASSGTARAVLLSADIRRLDRDALSRLRMAGVAVVGLVTPGDEDAERRLRQLGVEHVLAGDAPAAEISEAVSAAVATAAAPGGTPVELAFGEPRAALSAGQPAADDDRPAEPGSGRLVAVWGPTGAPGRSTVAVGLATELALAGTSTLLADADVYGGVLAQLLGLLDESAGLAAAARLANNGSLDLAALAKVAVVVSPRLRLLTGISRADRWPELRPAALETVLTLGRSMAAVTVVDCGFCLEQDEEISYDTMAPRRNGATLTVLDSADTIVAVCAADPVGVQRFVRALAELREIVPDTDVVVVLNKVRRGPVGADPEAQLAQALERYAGVRDPHVVPADPAAMDEAALHGRSLAEVAASSAARASLARLAARVGGVEAAAPRRSLRRRVGARRLSLR